MYTDGNIVKIIGARPWYIFQDGVSKQFEPNTEYTTDEFKSMLNV